MTAGSPATFGYEALRDSLTHAGTVLTLPELHGGICGALCAGGPVAAERWLDDALADEDDKKVAPVHDWLHEVALAAAGRRWATTRSSSSRFSRTTTARSTSRCERSRHGARDFSRGSA